MRLALLIVGALVLPAVPAAAQLGPSLDPDGGLSLAVGGRALIDFEQGDPTLGVEARLHLPWPGMIQLRAAYDFTFLDGLTERTLILDALLTSGGVAIGGGPVVRNTRIEPDDPREDIDGWSAVVALGGDPRVRSRTSLGIELRFFFLDPFEPRTLGVTLGLPLF